MTPRIRAVMVGTAMIATSRQRTRQLLIDSGEPLRTGSVALPAGTAALRRAGVTGTGRLTCEGSPAEPAPWPLWPRPTARGPPGGGPPLPLNGRPEAGVSGPPFPLVIERLRTALTPRSFKGN